ncbi:ferric reductase-like transmembrane domain-containing protein [Salipiger sp. CCB-MM3]|uniref:ferric reductase-like transmembrane domain-containing protein n=1 Tax=Salipiger sp. CCB-MM3 TaxID=1792508 RepID=UPI000ACDD144|nr:ferric reductase-like transmembrane domain-containing protein [Salipiger sp. CCB-MM3]
MIWSSLALAIGIPVAAAAVSPLLAWRQPVYIASGFAGIIALGLLLLQPLLAIGALPGLQGGRGRRVHRWIGAALVIFVVLHVAGLWLTSPPDVIDALLFVSPTPFSAWGVIAMWGVILSGLLALRRRRGRRWRLFHRGLGAVVVGCSVIHALLIEGTMEPLSKALLCGLVLLATLAAVLRPRLVRAGRRRASGAG